MRRLLHLGGLTETKEGRLTVIVVVGGTLALVVAWANVAMANAADDQAERIRQALRSELVTLPDAAVHDFPATAGEIERRARQALADRPARLVGVGRPEGEDEVVVAAETGWAWQIRCVQAELRGHATVLTEQRDGPC